MGPYCYRQMVRAKVEHDGIYGWPEQSVTFAYWIPQPLHIYLQKRFLLRAYTVDHLGERPFWLDQAGGFWSDVWKNHSKRPDQHDHYSG